MTPSPEAVELAIELVTYVARHGRPSAVSAEAMLNTIGVDQLGRIEIALEVETRFDHIIPDGEVHEWRCVGDIAASVAPLLTRSAA